MTGDKKSPVGPGSTQGDTAQESSCISLSIRGDAHKRNRSIQVNGLELLGIAALVALVIWAIVPQVVDR